MKDLTVRALRVVLAAVLVGTVFVQLVMVPLVAIDLEEAGADVVSVQVPIVVILVLGVGTVQVVVVCVWKLLTMVRRGTVFSDAAFRYVDIVFAAVVAAAVLTFGLAVTLAPGEVPPGIVLMLCGVSLTVGGGALIVLVLRMLLAQAVARDSEANDLQAELAAVI